MTMETTGAVGLFTGGSDGGQVNSTETAPTTQEQSTQTTQAPTTTETAGSKWYEGFKDPAVKQFMLESNYPDVETAAKSLMDTKRYLGSEKVPIPKTADDAEGWNNFYKAAGRPDSAEGYQLPLPENANAELVTGIKTTFHEAGLSAAQASKVTEWYTKAEAAAAQAKEAQFVQQQNEGLNAIKQEWGGEFTKNAELGRRAAQQFKVDPENIDKLERAWGTAATIKFFADLGKGLVEDRFISGSSPESMPATPEAAQVALNALESDKAFIQKYTSGDAEATAKITKLRKLAAQES
jgi:hypothetical protein